MQAPSGQATAPPLQALLTDRALAGDWVLNSGKPSIRLTTRSTLTVRGCTRPLSFHAEASRQGDSEICVDAEARINRADFGLTWNPARAVGLSNTLAIHAVFTRR